jgi:hypothetical protein
MKDLAIEYINIEEIKPYENNAKIHTPEQIERIKDSIQAWGFNDPIAIWNDGEIIEGHGRYQAAMELGMETVPVIRLDHLDEEGRRAYMLVHNKLTMDTGFDLDILNEEIERILSYNMEDFGFDVLDELLTDTEQEESKYTTKVQVPQYEPTGKIVELEDLCNKAKTESLIEEINESTVPEDVKQFLIEAAHRHSVFNYKNIAEYYARADKETQELMERSALVIIDFDDAIANGYASLEQSILNQIEDDEDDE